jgi:hypothetical protein
MRKPIRSFVVETTKSRHEQRSANGRASFVTMLADAEPKFRDHPAFNLTRDPEPAATTTLDRPAPKRILEALVPPEAEIETRLPEPLEKKRGRPRKISLDTDDVRVVSETRPLNSNHGDGGKPAYAAKRKPVAEDAVSRTTQPREQVAVPASEPAPVRDEASALESESRTATRRPTRNEANGGLKPGQRWMAQLPKAMQKRMLGRPRNAR